MSYTESNMGLVAEVTSKDGDGSARAEGFYPIVGFNSQQGTPIPIMLVNGQLREPVKGNFDIRAIHRNPSVWEVLASPRAQSELRMESVMKEWNAKFDKEFTFFESKSA